jgi:hypothetical protein
MARWLERGIKREATRRQEGRARQQGEREHHDKPGKSQKQKKAPPVLISEGPEKRVAPCNRKNSKVRT